MKGHARQLMSSPVAFVSPDTPLADVARALASRGFGGLAVVDDRHAPTGFVSETDVARALLEGRVDVTARELMSAPAVVVDEFEPADGVLALMRERGIHHVLVLRAGRLVGIVAPTDAIRFYVEHELDPPPRSA